MIISLTICMQIIYSIQYLVYKSSESCESAISQFLRAKGDAIKSHLCLSNSIQPHRYSIYYNTRGTEKSLIFVWLEISNVLHFCSKIT